MNILKEIWCLINHFQTRTQKAKEDAARQRRRQYEIDAEARRDAIRRSPGFGDYLERVSEATRRNPNKDWTNRTH